MCRAETTRRSCCKQDNGRGRERELVWSKAALGVGGGDDVGKVIVVLGSRRFTPKPSMTVEPRNGWPGEASAAQRAGV